ncbi:MAG: hypothetical protein IJP30_03485 [Clostridia bacterium]|nr:hypothetical protein [Clostridia bacterium]
MAEGKYSGALIDLRKDLSMLYMMYMQLEATAGETEEYSVQALIDQRAALMAFTEQEHLEELSAYLDNASNILGRAMSLRELAEAELTDEQIEALIKAMAAQMDKKAVQAPPFIN